MRTPHIVENAAAPTAVLEALGEGRVLANRRRSGNAEPAARITAPPSMSQSAMGLPEASELHVLYHVIARSTHHGRFVTARRKHGASSPIMNMGVPLTVRFPHSLRRV